MFAYKPKCLISSQDEDKSSASVSGLFLSSFLLSTDSGCRKPSQINASISRYCDAAVSMHSHKCSQNKAFFVRLRLYFLSHHRKQHSAVELQRAKWSIKHPQKQPTSDSAADCQSRSCMSLIVLQWRASDKSLHFLSKRFTAKQG